MLDVHLFDKAAGAVSVEDSAVKVETGVDETDEQADEDLEGGVED